MIFLIGGSGFVGSGFARALQSRGRPFTIIGKHNYHQFAGQGCELLINANGNSRKPLAAQAPIEEFQASVASVRATLVDFPCKLYIHLSTCDVYPDCSSPSTTLEEHPLDVAAQSAYGFHKYLAELCVRHAAPGWLILRLGGFVGPGLKKNAIFDILHGGRLWLDPQSELQFMRTDALAECVLTLIDQGVRNEVLNLCGKGLVKLAEVIDWVGHPVIVEPRSPKVRYDISIAKASRLIEIPASRETVRTFVQAELAGSLAPNH